MDCAFCDLSDETVLAEGEHCVAIDARDRVLSGAAMIIPRAHRATPFDLTAEEWAETHRLVVETKAILDAAHRPDGYNLGWNCGQVAGQTVLHAHLHVMPRWADEPLAGHGIRHYFKRTPNRRPDAPIA